MLAPFVCFCPSTSSASHFYLHTFITDGLITKSIYIGFQIFDTKGKNKSHVSKVNIKNSATTGHKCVNLTKVSSVLVMGFVNKYSKLASFVGLD